MASFDSCFQFVDETTWDRPADCLLVEIPPDLSTADELFCALEERLNLPGYFWRNWNALSDCLRDLHWVEQKTVVIRHMAPPKLAQIDSANYLSVLAEAAMDWKPDEPHELVVVFPKAAQTEVLHLLHPESATPDSPPSTPRG